MVLIRKNSATKRKNIQVDGTNLVEQCYQKEESGG